jgi:hypothetical protein
MDVTAGFASAIVNRLPPTVPAVADSNAATAWAREVALANSMAQVAPAGDDTLLSMVQDSWREPALQDLDSLNYVTWRDSHQDWFAQQFPWIFKAQAELRKDKAVQADYVEVLMVSGDIWQFHFDSATSVAQAHPKFEPAGIARLARHYGADEQKLLRAIDSTISLSVYDLRREASSQAKRYAEALRRWHNSLGDQRKAKPEGYGDEVVSSLLASGYLANVRTAAYLWSKTHPSQAVRLLTDDSGVSIHFAHQIAPDEEMCINELRHQAMSAQSGNQVALDWLITPLGNGCLSKTIESRRKLAALAAKLLPENSAAPTR